MPIKILLEPAKYLLSIEYKCFYFFCHVLLGEK
jgi:hypothetical protein